MTSGLQIVTGMAITVLFVTACLVLYSMLPRLQHRFPRLSALVSALFPLPCTHSDADGVSVMQRERREVAGVSVPHWVCPRCGHIDPIVGREFYEFAAHAQIRPAHESMKAKRTTPTAQVVKRDFAQRGRRG